YAAGWGARANSRDPLVPPAARAGAGALLDGHFRRRHYHGAAGAMVDRYLRLADHAGRLWGWHPAIDVFAGVAVYARSPGGYGAERGWTRPRGGWQLRPGGRCQPPRGRLHPRSAPYPPGDRA